MPVIENFRAIRTRAARDAGYLTHRRLCPRWCTVVAVTDGATLELDFPVVQPIRAECAYGHCHRRCCRRRRRPLRHRRRRPAAAACPPERQRTVLCVLPSPATEAAGSWGPQQKIHSAEGREGGSAKKLSHMRDDAVSRRKSSRSIVQGSDRTLWARWAAHVATTQPKLHHERRLR